MRIRLSHIVLLISVANIGLAFCQTNTEATANKSPKCHFQILNGISSGPVDIFLDNKLIFPSSTTGQRISSLGWPSEKFEVRLVDKNSNREKKQVIELGEGNYATLILTGDFQPLPKAENAKPDDPPEVRTFIHTLSNKLEPGEGSIRVRLVNGLVDKPVTVKAGDGKTWTIPPLKIVSATSLPQELRLQASLDNKDTALYLAQKQPAKNISVVFFPANGGLGFRAMVETTPETIKADAQETQASN